MTWTIERKREYERKYRLEHREERNRQSREYARKNKLVYSSRSLKVRTEFKSRMSTLKKELGCKECGLKDVRVLEFHHRDPLKKEFNIGQLVHCSKLRLDEEVSKCDLLCANCHKIVQWEYNLLQGKYITHD